MIAVDKVRGPCWTIGRRDKSIQVKLVHRGIDALLLRKTAAVGEILLILGIVQVALCLRFFHQLLAKVRKLTRAVLLVKGNDFL